MVRQTFQLLLGPHSSDFINQNPFSLHSTFPSFLTSLCLSVCLSVCPLGVVNVCGCQLCLSSDSFGSTIRWLSKTLPADFAAHRPGGETIQQRNYTHRYG